MTKKGKHIIMVFGRAPHFVRVGLFAARTPSCRRSRLRPPKRGLYNLGPASRVSTFGGLLLSLTLLELGVWNAELGLSLIPNATFATPNSNVSVHIIETSTGRCLLVHLTQKRLYHRLLILYKSHLKAIHCRT